MKFVLLHGPPASGKFTIGRAVAAQTGFRFFHNHLVVDALLAVFEFGSPPFIALRERIWRDVFTEAVGSGISGLVFTFTPEQTVAQEFVDWIFGDLPRLGAPVYSVQLSADDAEIARRIGGADRKEHGKLTDPRLYGSLVAAGAFSRPVVPRTDLRIDTGRLPPADAAREIVASLARG